MKKHLVSITIIVLSAFNLFGQSEKFTSAMKSAITTFQAAKTSDDLIAAGNTFSRIATAEPKEWLPNYYAAHANLTAGFMTTGADMEKGQKLIDNAQLLLAAAQKVAAQPADLSEIAVLQAYIYIGKVTEDPMTKGAELSGKVFEELGKAAAMNPANPRAPMIQGMFTMNMPEFYGGGTKKAKPLLEKAAGLFASEATDGVRPIWGKEQNKDMLDNVTKQTETK